MRAHTIVHIDPGPLAVPDLLRCAHPDERMSFRIVDADVQVWLTGTAAEFDEFAVACRAMAQLIRLEVPS